MKVNEEKKAAIKLINQYAEQYLQKEAENKLLRIEIEDLKKNIKINKEIIEGFFNPDQKEKSKLFLKKTKEEIGLLNQANNALRQELISAKDKISYYELLLNESILKYNNSIDSFQSKIFSLENLVKKKDAVICYLNLKLSSVYDSKYTGQPCDREYYILEPQTSLLLINSELETEKEFSIKLLTNLQSSEETIESLKQQIKEKANKREEDSSYDESINSNCTNSRSTVIKENPKNNNFKGHINPNPNTIESIAEMVDENKPNWEKNEWIEILRSVKLTPESLNSMGKIDMYKNITEIIEVLVKTIMERNMQLRVLLKSNNELNVKNSTLSDHLVSMKKDLIKLKKELKELNKLRSCNISMVQPDKKHLELSLLEEKKSQCRLYEQYLEEFNAKSMRINDSIADEAIKECCKSFVTHESIIHKKGDINDINNKTQSFISDTMPTYAEQMNGGNRYYTKNNIHIQS